MTATNMRLWSGALIAACVLLGGDAARGEDWPAWRGPRADGVSAEKNLPTRWSPTENVKWKTPLPDRGNSTPIIVGDKIFLTQAREKGKYRGVMCLDRATGKPLWTKEIEYAEKEPTHDGNPYCSASAICDGSAVYAWHGSAGVVAYDLDGKELWRKSLGAFTHIWGNAGSPLVVGDLLILNCGPGDRAFVVALDKKSGREVWKFDTPTSKPDVYQGSWSSPVVVRHDNRELLLVSLPKALVALHPTDGKEVWRCEGPTDLVYTSPIHGGGIVVTMCGYFGKAIAVRLGGSGDVTATNRLWITPEGKKEKQRIGSGIIRDGLIHMVDEPGIFECIKVDTGEVLWTERLCGTTWGSPVLADGKFYIMDQSGATYVFTANGKLDVVAKNELNEATNSSPAISGGNIYLRTDKHLWCIGK